MERVVIIVNGGLVESVFSTAKEMDVYVVDVDHMIGDEKPDEVIDQEYYSSGAKND